MQCHAPSLVKYGRLLQFANDTTLLCIGDNCQILNCTEVQWKLLEHDLKLLLNWSRMKLNFTKPSTMWFKPKHGPGTSHSIIDDQQLQEAEEQKYL